MWSRVVEVMLGVWLLMSPFVFGHSAGDTPLWVNDLLCGSLVIVCALLSYWRPTRHAHAFTLLTGAWLIVFAYRSGFGDASPAAQNQAILGLLLLMFAVIPNHASRASADWDPQRPPTDSIAESAARQMPQ